LWLQDLTRHFCLYRKKKTWRREYIHNFQQDCADDQEDCADDQQDCADDQQDCTDDQQDCADDQQDCADDQAIPEKMTRDLM
jgi:hypothetical protein